GRWAPRTAASCPPAKRWNTGWSTRSYRGTSAGRGACPARVEKGPRPDEEERGRDEPGLLLLREVAEGGEEAHRGPDRLHLRRVHRALQRHHRRGGQPGQRARQLLGSEAARDQGVPRPVR